MEHGAVAMNAFEAYMEAVGSPIHGRKRASDLMAAFAALRAAKLALAAGRSRLLIRLAPGCSHFSERRIGKARQGGARLGKAWRGEARLGKAWRGKAMRG